MALLNKIMPRDQILFRKAEFNNNGLTRATNLLVFYISFYMRDSYL